MISHFSPRSARLRPSRAYGHKRGGDHRRCQGKNLLRKPQDRRKQRRGANGDYFFVQLLPGKFYYYFDLSTQNQDLPFCGTTINTSPGAFYEFLDPNVQSVHVNTCIRNFDSKLAVFEVSTRSHCQCACKQPVCRTLTATATLSACPATTTLAVAAWAVPSTSASPAAPDTTSTSPPGITPAAEHSHWRPNATTMETATTSKLPLV